MSGIDAFQQLTQQLAQAAAKLRDGELDPQEAACLVEECARLAGEAAAELDRRVRAAADDAP
jgi:CHASE3 domain sensor protein